VDGLESVSLSILQTARSGGKWLNELKMLWKLFMFTFNTSYLCTSSATLHSRIMFQNLLFRLQILDLQSFRQTQKPMFLLEWWELLG